jgi:HlyD family secretion protein
MKRIPSRWWIVGSLTAAFVLLVAWLAAPRAREVDLAQVDRGVVADTLTDQGYARVRQAYVVSAPTPGQIDRLGLKVGDRVVAGQAVARIRPSASSALDPRLHAQSVAAVSAALAAEQSAVGRAAAARALLDRETARVERDRSLAADGIVSRAGLEAAETAYRAARAESQSAAADVSARRADVARARAGLIGPDAATSVATVVGAPVSGTVTRVFQESARTTQAGEALVEIADTRGLEGAIEFRSQDAARIREGMAAEIFDWGGRPLPARVRRVEPQGFVKVSALGVEEQRALVLLQFEAPPELGAGYRLWARVELRTAPNVVRAPIGALVRDGGAWAVYRLEGGRARLVRIRVGILTESHAEVLNGLSAGDRLVIYPSDQIRDGVRIRGRS